MKKLLTLLFVLISIGILAQGSKLASVNPGADGGSRSLTGSYVAFDPTGGGDQCYTPGETQDFIFRTESFTPDWEFVLNLWLKFPTGWVVNNVSIFGTPACDNGGEILGMTFIVQTPPNIVDIVNNRIQAYTDHCTVYYMVNVTVGDATGNAEVSWYWGGDGWGSTPHHPCSADGFTPDGEVQCEEMINPPALVPQNLESLECSDNALFSQPPLNANNAYFSDEGTYWLDQRIYENFSGLVNPIGGVTFWGIMWYQSDCYSPGVQAFEVTFYQDNAGTIGSPVKSFSRSIMPEVTGSTNSGAQLLRYDFLLPSAVNLTTGWLMIYKENPQNSDCSFAWSRTDNGDNLTGWNQSDGPIYYQPDNVAFCLTGVNELVPVSNWALFIAIGLILVAAIVRFRKLL